MTAGVGMPVDLVLLMSAVESVPQLLRRSRTEAIEDRRFGEAVYRAAIAEGSWTGSPTKTQPALAMQPDG